MTPLPDVFRTLSPHILAQLSAQIGLDASLQVADQINEEVGSASATLRSIPGIGSGPMGLTPDHVKATAEWKAARFGFNAATDLQRRWQAAMRKAHGKAVDKEIRARIHTRRQAKLKQQPSG